MKTSEYVHKVFETFEKMEDGAIFIIKDKVSPGNLVKFIDTVKLYMTYRNTIEFNNDYTRIRKTLTMEQKANLYKNKDIDAI